MLAGNEPEKLKGIFIKFFLDHNYPQGVTLWKWKRSCWICSPEEFRHEILNTFSRFGIVEFSSSPSPSDIEFMSGDAASLTHPSSSSSPSL